MKKNYYAFILTMPNVGSWNGKFSGEKKFYCQTLSISNKDKEIIENIEKEKSHYYNFGDGWGSLITIEKIDRIKKNFYDKKTKGFLGYKWMIDEICEFGRIKKIEERINRSIK